MSFSSSFQVVATSSARLCPSVSIQNPEICSCKELNPKNLRPSTPNPKSYVWLVRALTPPFSPNGPKALKAPTPPLVPTKDAKPETKTGGKKHALIHGPVSRMLAFPVPLCCQLQQVPRFIGSGIQRQKCFAEAWTAGTAEPKS